LAFVIIIFNKRGSHLTVAVTADEIQEGSYTVVYAYRCAERDHWDLRRCYCTDCAPSTIETPTLGVTELLAQVWLGTLAQPRTRTHELCLTEVECVAVSPPSESVDP
jgi:hypothetical protein